MSITATVQHNNPISPNVVINSDNAVRSTINEDLRLKSSVTVDSRDDKIVATTATIGDLNDVLDDFIPSILDTEFAIYYTEYTYTSSDLTRIDVWENDNKGSLLFTKEFYYTNDDLTSIILTDVINSKVLTKTLTYDIEGNLESVNRT